MTDERPTVTQGGPWQPITTAPRETELLVGRYVNDEWRICQSGLYFDAGNELEGEPSCWFWHCDWDNGGVTDNEGPTHWMLLPAAPENQAMATKPQPDPPDKADDPCPDCGKQLKARLGGGVGCTCGYWFCF